MAECERKDGGWAEGGGIQQAVSRSLCLPVQKTTEKKLGANCCRVFILYLFIFSSLCTVIDLIIKFSSNCIMYYDHVHPLLLLLPPLADPFLFSQISPASIPCHACMHVYSLDCTHERNMHYCLPESDLLCLTGRYSVSPVLWQMT